MRRDKGELDERFAAFVRDRGDNHLRLAILLTGDRQAGEDLVQASLLKLYRAWPRLDLSTDPDAYLRRIIVNTRRSWWRAKWRQETPMELAADETGAGSIGPLPGSGEDFADRHAVGVLVRQALAALPRQQRAALVLRYCADLPETEVAELLGCSVGTVKTHTHRGVRALRELLGSELANQPASGGLRGKPTSKGAVKGNT